MRSKYSDEKLRSMVERIPGWLPRIDFDAMSFLLTRQMDQLIVGDVAELGTYLGKSAALIGDRLAEGETFTVVDLFGAAAVATDNVRENAREYPGLNRGAFETNYLSVHDVLPCVVQNYSWTIRDCARIGSHRFVHVDASHLYDNVVADIDAAFDVLQPNGLIVFDDYRSNHTPGVAAAVWGAVANGLKPFAITEQKLYATWGETGALIDDMRKWRPSRGRLADEQVIYGNTVLRYESIPHVATSWLPPRIVPRVRRGAQQLKSYARGVKNLG